MDSTKNPGKGTPRRAPRPTPRPHKPEAAAKAGVQERFRRLKWNELVSRGDFVADEQRGFAPWEGPSGFRADAFERAIYRRYESRAAATERLP